MTRDVTTCQDFNSGARAIRSSGLTDAPLGREAATDFSLFRSASNISDTALDVIRPIVLGEGALIVTGYENLLAVLSVVMSIRPGLSYAERGALRIVLTDQSRPSGRVAHVARMTADRLAAHFLRPSGVNIPDPRDFRAIGAREALASGAVLVRIVNPDRLRREGKQAPEGVQANMVVGEDFAALSTAGFSRRDLLDRAIMIDRVASDGAAYSARRDVAEQFWSAGNPCNREVSKILDGMLRPASMKEAIAATVSATLGYRPFQGADGRHPVQVGLVSQALARVYENGFAFVSVPAGVGQSEIQEEIARRLQGNAMRMIGGGGEPEGAWAAHVETATGGRWSEERILDLLGQKAPLVLDGSIARQAGESSAQAAMRRMKCRYSMHGGNQGSSDFLGFPEILVEAHEVATSKGQQAAWSDVRERISQASTDALDKASQRHLDYLIEILEQSCDAALSLWKQGGMSSRVRTVSRRTGSENEPEQNLLPMFMGSDLDAGEPTDFIGEALANRALRSVDKGRVKMVVEIAQRRGPVICVVESDLARHCLARRAAELGEVQVLAIVPEVTMRAQSIATKDVSYQRADSADIAMTMLGSTDGGPVVIFTSCDQAAEMTLPAATAAVILSVPGEVDRVAAGLSSIDGLGKSAGQISCVTLEDSLVRSANTAKTMTSPGEVVAQAALQMRSAVQDAHDGVADIIEEMRMRLGVEVEQSTSRACHMAIVDSREPFSVFIVAGTSEEADQPAMPPRLIAVCRDRASGEEVVRRNQVGCAEFLASIEWPAPNGDPRVRPEFPGLEILDVIGRHMSHLTHWDARPERLVVPLEALASFVSREMETGEDMFSDLCLVSLEVIGRRWSHHLSESRRLARVDEAGFELAYKALLDRPVWELDDVRDEMITLIDRRIVEDASRPKTLHERVVAVIHGTGDAGLVP